MTTTPFQDRAKALSKTLGMKGLAEGCDHVREASWWNNVVSYGPWKGSGDARTFAPPEETFSGIAKLFGVTEAEVRGMIAADWYGVNSGEVMSSRVLEYAAAIDRLETADADLVLELIDRLKHASREKFLRDLIDQ